MPTLVLLLFYFSGFLGTRPDRTARPRLRARLVAITTRAGAEKYVLKVI